MPFPFTRRPAMRAAAVPAATPEAHAGPAEGGEQCDARPQDHPQVGPWQRPDGMPRAHRETPLPAKVLVPDPQPVPAAARTVPAAERPAARTEPARPPVLTERQVTPPSPVAVVGRIDADLMENLRIANQELRKHLRQAEAMLALRDGVTVEQLVVPWPKQTPATAVPPRRGAGRRAAGSV